jgi:hypothetical protein
LEFYAELRCAYRTQVALVASPTQRGAGTDECSSDRCLAGTCLGFTDNATQLGTCETPLQLEASTEDKPEACTAQPTVCVLTTVVTGVRSL